MNPSAQPGPRRGRAAVLRATMVVLVLLLGAGLRLYGLDAQALWDDEGISYSRISEPLGNMLSQLPTEQMPAYYALLHAWTRAFGDSVWMMRALSALWGVLAIFAIYLTGNQWFGQPVGLGAALLLAISPSAIRQSQTVRMYPMLIAALLLAAVAGTRALGLSAAGPSDRRHRGAVLAFLAYGATATCAAITHLIGLLGIASLSIWAIWRYRRDRRTVTRWLAAQAPAAIACALWLLYSLLLSPAGETLSTTGGRLPSLISLGRQAVALLGAAWGVPGDSTTSLAGAMIALLGAIGLARTIRGPRADRATLLWQVPGATLAVLFALAWLADAPIYARNLAPQAPWAYLAAALGLGALDRVGRWAPVFALAAVVAAVAVNLGAYYRRPVENLAPLVSQIAANSRPGDAIVHTSKWRARSFAYYDESGLPSFEEPDVAELQSISDDYQRIWLLVYGYHPTDDIESCLMAACPQIGTWFSGTTQLMLYLPDQAPSQISQPLRADFGPIHLLGYDLRPPGPDPGDLIQLTLWWHCVTAVEPGYKVFVHLVDESGRIWGQRDAEPVDGLRPTWTWAPGDIVSDPQAFVVDPSAPPGNYRLLVGLYDHPTGRRLPILGAEAPHQDGAVLLQEIQLAQAP